MERTNESPTRRLAWMTLIGLVLMGALVGGVLLAPVGAAAVVGAVKGAALGAIIFYLGAALLPKQGQ